MQSGRAGIRYESGQRGAIIMERHAIAMKIKEGQMEKYHRTLGKFWPELTAFLDRNGIRNFSIWNAENLIFLYYECREGMETFLSEAEKVFDAFDKIPDMVWEDEYRKYSQVLDAYKNIRLSRWNTQNSSNNK